MCTINYSIHLEEFLKHAVLFQELSAENKKKYLSSRLDAKSVEPILFEILFNKEFLSVFDSYLHLADFIDIKES